jgi:hypothetical protein
LPESIHVLGVPPFENHTLTPRVSQNITEAVEREIIQRTRYRVEPDASGADAVLHGSVLAVDSLPVTFDPTTGQVSMVEVTLRLKAWLTETRSGKELYRNDNLVFHEQYQVGQQTAGFFEEDQLAFERMSRTIAKTLASAILENF